MIMMDREPRMFFQPKALYDLIVQIAARGSVRPPEEWLADDEVLVPHEEWLAGIKAVGLFDELTRMVVLRREQDPELFDAMRDLIEGVTSELPPGIIPADDAMPADDAKYALSG
jgi:hypothetical protein